MNVVILLHCSFLLALGFGFDEENVPLSQG